MAAERLGTHRHGRSGCQDENPMPARARVPDLRSAVSYRNEWDSRCVAAHYGQLPGRGPRLGTIKGGCCKVAPVVHCGFMLTGGIPSAEMGPAHRPFVPIIEPDFLPEVCGPRAPFRRKGYGHSIPGLAGAASS